MSDSHKSHRQIAEFICRLVGREVDDSEPLISSQLIESVAAIQIVLFIEQRFGKTVTDDELILANFDTVQAMTAFVERKTEFTP